MKRIRLGVLAAVLLSCAAAMAAGKNAGTKDIVDTAVAAIAGGQRLSANEHT